MNEDRAITRAIKALDAGNPQPVIDLAAKSVLPLDAPVVAQAWRLATSIASANPANVVERFTDWTGAPRATVRVPYGNSSALVSDEQV